MRKKSLFETIAAKITAWAGSVTALTCAMLIIILWAASGPLFDFSDTWQLVINTGTTIITFLMVFVIQKSQNKDSKAIQLKLNELISANRYTSNRMVDIENLTEEELDVLRKFYRHLSDKAEEERDIHESHSIDTANEIHEKKSRRNREELRRIGFPAVKSNEPDAEGEKANRQ